MRVGRERDKKERERGCERQRQSEINRQKTKRDIYRLEREK